MQLNGGDMSFDLTGFATHLLAMEASTQHALEGGLEKVLVEVEKKSKSMLGTYQDGWSSLAYSTQENRVRKGFSPDDPGLMTGAMRDSISHHKDSDLSGEVGSNDKNLVYFELGTIKQPPRPVLSLAAEKSEGKIKDIVGKAVVSGLMGGGIGEVSEFSRTVE